MARHVLKMPVVQDMVHPTAVGPLAGRMSEARPGVWDSAASCSHDSESCVWPHSLKALPSCKSRFASLRAC